MTATDAERARRSRRHRAGDHTLCNPSRCDEAITLAPVAQKKGTRGSRLYQELYRGLGPADLALLEEAARIADRLDRLDAILIGTSDEWLRFRTNDDASEVTVTINNVLSEARQQAIALKQLLSELRQASAPAKTPPMPKGNGGDKRGVTDIAERIARRRSSPS